MKKLYILALSLVITFTVTAQDTFSIIAVDPDTGDVGSAGASCIGNTGGLVDIITDIIPGKGGINSQAFVCIPNSNLIQGIERMEAGDSPQEIIDFLLANDNCSAAGNNPAFRQYGIVDFDDTGVPRTAGWTGDMADDYKEDRQGSNYSVQGNILLNQSIIDNMEIGFTTTEGTLADKLMGALQGANVPGADSRCLDAGTSSTSAYIIVYHSDDTPGNPYLKLSADQLGSGVEPIDVLQGLYDNFLSADDFNISEMIQIFPNPAENELNINTNELVELKRVSVFDVNGKRVLETQNNLQSIDISVLKAGVYFLNLESTAGPLTLKFVKK